MGESTYSCRVQNTPMKKYISFLAIGAFVSIASLNAGEQCCPSTAAAKKAAVQKVAAAESCSASKTACTVEKASACSATPAKKSFVRRAPATAKGGYRG
jgi:hypothetical protein